MGIQGFETFLLKHHPRACPRLRIKDLVSEYRTETGRSEAVAVFDTNILIRQCLEDLDVVCGGQLAEYKQNLLKYVHRLQAVGISPVFFLDGMVDKGKMTCWLDRKDETHRRIEKIYNCVDQGWNTSPIPVEGCVLPSGIYECTILTLKEANFPVFCATSECDLEIARYAREHACFGIFSRDTDFVILNGARFYLSLFRKHFKVSDLSTYLFDREAISKALQLNPEHLPLLASLLHNDYVDGSYLMPLYSKLLGRPTAELRPDERYNLEHLVPCLVKLIRADLWKQSDPVETILDRTFNGYPPFLLKNLALKMGLRNQFEMKERLRQQLEVSLEMYEYAPPQSQPPRTSPEPQPETDVDLEVLELARARHRSVTFLSSAVLSLLTLRVIQMGPALEDPRLVASRTSEAALRPFRRRIYGLLQVEGPFTEWIVPTKAAEPNQKLEPCLVEPITLNPEVHPHPGLLALWRSSEEEGTDGELVGNRWRLFAWALASHRDPSVRVDALADVLGALPKHLVVPASVVYLLYHSGALWGLSRPPVELVRLLTRTCLMAGLLREEQLSALKVTRYDRLEVHVAALFMRAFTYVCMLNDVVGDPVSLVQLQPALYFDGKLFHHIFTDEPLDPELLVLLNETMEMEEKIINTTCEETPEICIEE